MNNINLKLSYSQSNRYARMKMNFANGGEVTIPGKSGGYVIASGCGSGKTTVIREAILNMWDTGVLYSASTIEECNKMYRFLVENGQPYGLTENMIAVLHSNNEDDGVKLELLKKGVNKLADYPVLICTHHKLMHEHNEVLLAFNGRNTSKNAVIPNIQFSRSHMATVSKVTDPYNNMETSGAELINRMASSPRANVFVDEVPMCEGLSVELDKMRLNLFTVQDYTTYEGVERVPADNPLGYIEVPKTYVNFIPNSTKVINDYIGFKDIVNEYKTQLGFYKEDTEANKMRNEILSDLIYDNLDPLIKSKVDRIRLTRTLADLLYIDSDFRLMIFEGTGDLTFYDSDIFDVLTCDVRYSSPIYVRNSIPFNIKRSYKNQKEFLNDKENRDMEWGKVLDVVANIVQSDEMDNEGNVIPCTGTLIQTWKGYSIKQTDPEDYVNTEVSERNNFYNPEFHLPLKVRQELLNRGVIKPFEVIHFMSGLDRATNQFKDFNRIIILGNLQVPNSVVGKFNQDYRVNTTPELFRTYQMSQLICRTKIRLHNGDPIFVYYTDDIDPKVIDRTVKYLTNQYSASTLAGSSIRSKLVSLGIKPKWLDVAELFSDLDCEFKRCILNRLPYRLEFRLDDIFQLIPVSRKKSEKYTAMVNYFRKLGIDIVILTERRNQYSKY